MKSRRFLDSRVGYLFASIVTLLGIAAPAALTSVVSAGVVTDRSMALDSSAANATGVEYTLTFTPATTEATGVVIVDFCNDSPIIGTTCTAPSGFSAASATLPSGVVASTSSLRIAQALVAATPVTLVFNNIHNPTNATTVSTGFYARVHTYANGTAADGHTSAASPGSYIDSGGIAMAITDPIQISAAVRETMTFCVSAAAPTADCGGTSPPTLELGHGTPKALDSSVTDTATAYTQISTNASKGAVVNMKTNNTCGGLFRMGETDTSVCGIAPVATGHNAITQGASALFGMRVDAADNSISGSTGSVTPTASYADAAEYGMNWVSGNATGVGSAYGDTIYDTDDAPIDNINIPLIFAATVTNTTAAGLYKANLNLIATGTY